MKKLFLISFLSIASLGHAVTYKSAGSILQAPCKINSSTGYLTLDVDLSGFLGNISVTAVTTAQSVTVISSVLPTGAATQSTLLSMQQSVAQESDQLAQTALLNSIANFNATLAANSPTLGPQPKSGSASVVLSESYVYASATAELVTTSGLAVNVSYVAGASCNDCRVKWSTRDAAGAYYDYGGSSTIPGTLGHFATASATAEKDDGFNDGQFLYFKAPTGSVTVFVTVRKRQ